MKTTMTKETKTLTVFYSWQSDSPKKTNSSAIRNALRDACSFLESDKDFEHVHLDEATKDTSGSPNIPDVILQKIRKSDVFVCDITTIYQVNTEKTKYSPNPNVVFELGYAVAHLGWERVIMLFNTAQNANLDEVPFDFDRQRISPYAISTENATDKTCKDSLNQLLITALNAVVKANPLKPCDAELNHEQIKRRRDILNLEWIFSKVHIGTIDLLLEELPKIINVRAFHFYEEFTSVFESSYFHLYDSDIMEAMAEFKNSWEKCGMSGMYHHDNGNPNIVIILNSGHPSKQETIQKLHTARFLLEKNFENLLRIVRTKFIEIDLELLSTQAWKSWQLELEQRQKLLSE
jgi:hypothetical protein